MDNIANRFTLARILLTPVVAFLLYLEGEVAAWITLCAYIIAAITDFFDGYFARLRSEQTEIGRFLDSIADKLLVATVIVVLIAQHRIYGWWVLPAVIILCREIMISGLREFLAGLQVALPVTVLAKWKTLLQMIALGFLIIAQNVPVDWPIQQIGEAGLALAGAFTVITGYDYLRSGLSHMRRYPHKLVKKEKAILQSQNSVRGQ